MYVNPIEILGLSNATDTTSIDNEIVKKAKRKLFADIDLSDNGVFEYYGLQLTKGNCEKAIDELTNNDIKEYYLYLANNKPLNEFLAIGKDAIFKNFKQESIYKLPEFIKFISPYFTPKFDKALLAAFENDNADLTKAILNTSTLIAQTDLNSAFKSVSNNIQNKIAEIDEITKDIKNEESAYDEDDIEHVVQLVKEHFPTNTLNCLPQYFQSQILKIANSINYLSNSIWDAFDTTQVPNDLTEYLLTLNISGLDRPTFENNYKIIKRKNDERKEQEKYAPILKKYAVSLMALRKLREEIENETKQPKVAIKQINSILSIDELNATPSVLSEIRNQIAMLFRGISVSIWNKYSEIDESLSLIRIAMTIKVDSETKDELSEALKQLLELKQKQKDNEKNEIQSLIKMLENINSQISSHGMINIKADKIKEMLNELFTDKLINSLAESKELALKRNLFYTLEKTLVKLDAFYSNSFFKRIKPIGNNDGELAVSIEKNISGVEFKAKNVLNNVGTGVGKANQAMVNNLPPQLILIIYIFIIVSIIAAIGALFGN
jgi:hypothetical protein